jgi:hypothetical protein
LQGNYYNSGTVNANNSTFQLTGNAIQSFNPGGTASGRELNNLTINKTGGAANLVNDLVLNGNFSLQNGTFGPQNYNYDIYVDGNWTRNGGTTFNHERADVYFNGGYQEITGTGADDFYNVILQGSNADSLGGNVDINNNLTINSGVTLDVSSNNYSLNVGGYFDNDNGGIFNARSGTVTFDGGSNSNLYSGGTDGNHDFYSIIINKSGGAYLNYDDYDLRVNNDLTIQNGQLRSGYITDVGYPDIEIYGDWTNNGSYNAARDDSVKFLGTSQNISGTGTNDFNNVQLAGSGTKTITSNIDINRRLKIESGVTLVVNGSNTLKIGRDFRNEGTFTCNTSTLEFEEHASWGTAYLETNSSSLYNLVIGLYNEDYDLDLEDDLTVLNNLTVSQGDLDVTSSNYSITVGGSWNIETFGEFQSHLGTVTFNGAGSGNQETITSNSEYFNNFTINANNCKFTLSDNMDVDGNLLINNGQLLLDGNDLYFGNSSSDSLAVTDSLVLSAGSEIRMYNNTELVVNNGGYLKLTGSLGNPAALTNQGSGSYSCDILNGGTIAAQNYLFESMDTDGIYVQSGASIDAVNNFSNGTFTKGASGGRLLRIGNNETHNIASVNFPSDPGGGAYNVYKQGQTGVLTFSDAKGAFEGDDHDYDLGPADNIVWSYTTDLRTWDGSESVVWSNANNWTPAQVPTANNRVTIPSGPSNQPVVTATTDSCYHLTIESGASLTIGDASNTGKLFVSGDVNIEGTFRFANQGSVGNIRDTLEAAGNWSNSGTFTHNSRGVVILVGTSDQYLNSGGDIAGKRFYNLKINKTGGTLYLSNNNIDVDNNIYLQGSATGDKITVEGTLDINEDAIVKMQGGSQGITIEGGGTLKAIGTESAHLAEVTRYGSSGYYPVIFNNGSTLNAAYAKFSYTNGSGVWIKSGATIETGNKLQNCIFENGSGTSYLRISNNQNLGTIAGVQFNSGSTNPEYNIYYDGSGSAAFNNYKGGLAATRYEYDNGSDPVGNVRWTFTETQNVSSGNSYTFGNDLVLTVNNAGTATAITVQLVDQRFNNYIDAYARYYTISTTPSDASGYNTNIRMYYSDGTRNSSNEIPSLQDDADTKIWVNIGGANFGPYDDGSSSTENYVDFNGIASNLANSWFPSNSQDEQSLPVELASFTALPTEKGIEISWETASETENAYWIIKRTLESKDDESEEIARIDGQGSKSAATQYNFVDNNIEVDTKYVYSLISVSYNGVQVVEGTVEVTSLRPEKFELSQNYPNPFNGGTTIRFALPQDSRVKITIYNILGQKIRTLADNKFPTGYHKITWDGRNDCMKKAASGMYIYTMESKKFRAVKKMLYVK